MADPDFTDRAVLSWLLGAHPRVVERAVLIAELSDLHDVPESIERLCEVGLVSRVGDLVSLTRAAARFEALDPT